MIIPETRGGKHSRREKGEQHLRPELLRVPRPVAPVDAFLISSSGDWHVSGSCREWRGWPKTGTCPPERKRKGGQKWVKLARRRAQLETQRSTCKVLSHAPFGGK